MRLAFSFSFPILKFHLYLYFSGVGGCFLFRLPLVRRLPVKIQFVLYVVVKLLFILLICTISRSVFVLLMDDLTRAVAQFYPEE